MAKSHGQRSVFKPNPCPLFNKEKKGTRSPADVLSDAAVNTQRTSSGSGNNKKAQGQCRWIIGERFDNFGEDYPLTIDEQR